MKRILCFLFAVAVMGLSRYDLIAQPLPDGFEWVYGCWENPRTGDCYIIGKDGIRENMTPRWVGYCFLKEYPTVDVWSQPLKSYEFSFFDRKTIVFGGPFGCETYLFIGYHVLQTPGTGRGEDGQKLVKMQAPPEKSQAKVENRALGKWELAESENITLEISESTIKRTTPRRTEQSSYTLSEEGYLITENEIFVWVMEDGVLHHHYSNTDSYIISTYLRPPAR